MPIRVMVVDDSVVVRGMICGALEKEPRIQIVGTAANGAAALSLIPSVKPEVVVMDVEMPEMDGMSALPLILKADPHIKVIMASSLTQRNAELSLKALEMGAADTIGKPEARKKDAQEIFFIELKEKVLAHGGIARQAAGGAPVASVKPAQLKPSAGGPIVTPPLKAGKMQALAIASSTGGPAALLTVFGGLKGEFKDIPIFITQHMPPTFTTLLAKQLAMVSGKPAKEGEHGEVAKAGHIYLAPGDYHMTVKRIEGQPTIQLDQGPAVNFCRPAADPMLMSLTELYASGLTVVVLTGIGQDGMEGARAALARNARIVAQDEATSVVYGMPKAVAEAGLAHAVLPIGDIAPYLLRAGVSS